MSNWIVDIEYMTVRHVKEKLYSQIKYKNGNIYHYWNGGWAKCVDAITDEYLKQRELEVERILLEGR